MKEIVVVTAAVLVSAATTMYVTDPLVDFHGQPLRSAQAIDWSLMEVPDGGSVLSESLVPEKLQDQ